MCVECGKRYKPRFEESAVTFAKRIYCSHQCVCKYLNRRRFLLKNPNEEDMSR